MRLSDFDYVLPKELIAQSPAETRDSSRLMVVNRKTGETWHDHFYNLPKYLKPTDLLVFNDTKVFPARLFGYKPTGGKVEVLLLRPGWKFISHPGLKNGQQIVFTERLSARVVDGELKFNVDNAELMRLLDEIGHTPLPTYIAAPRGVESEKKTRRRYQTIYAKNTGSAAAPTAGFHFTKKLIKRLRDEDIKTCFVTLHVGLGTFTLVKTDDITKHVMHSEYYEISPSAQRKVLSAKRVIAVGTTSVRVLESDWDKHETRIFIYPGYKFKHVDAIITNFHLPKSTLLMLVSAFAGRDLMMKAYKEAIKEKYRFFSFGDAMLIL